MDKLLLEYPWLPKIVQLSKEHGLDWLMMSALALELSGGDPRCRKLDKEFLYQHLGPDSPIYSVSEGWSEGVPDIDTLDLATRWGLFQILGRVAIERNVFSGRMINFVDIGSNTRAACQIVSSIIKEGGTTDEAITYFGADPKKILLLMEESRGSIKLLVSLTQDIASDE